MPCQRNRTHTHVHACARSYFLSFHCLLNYVVSCIWGIKGTLSSLTRDLSPRNLQVRGCERECLKRLWVYIPPSNFRVFTKFSPGSLNWSLDWWLQVLRKYVQFLQISKLSVSVFLLGGSVSVQIHPLDFFYLLTAVGCAPLRGVLGTVLRITEAGFSSWNWFHMTPRKQSEMWILLMILNVVLFLSSGVPVSL